MDKSAVLVHEGILTRGLNIDEINHLLITECKKSKPWRAGSAWEIIGPIHLVACLSTFSSKIVRLETFKALPKACARR